MLGAKKDLESWQRASLEMCKQKLTRRFEAEVSGHPSRAAATRQTHTNCYISLATIDPTYGYANFEPSVFWLMKNLEGCAGPGGHSPVSSEVLPSACASLIRTD